MTRFWTAPAQWPDETVYVVGGGPSLKSVDLAPLRKKNVIGVNCAFRVVPRAQIIFFADSRWWRWYGKEVDMGRHLMVSAGAATFDNPSIKRMRREYDTPLSTEPYCVAGPDSGYMAINLAFHMGASRIVLLGFDMGFSGGEAHWHADHPVPTPETNYTNLFLPKYPALVEALAAKGVEVIRATPSALGDVVPYMPLAEIVRLPRRERRQSCDTNAAILDTQSRPG